MDADHIRDEKVKLLKAVVHPDPRRGGRQVGAGPVHGGGGRRPAVVGYREEPGVAPDSETETFVALRLRVENWRWAGVPVYVRTGKRLPARVTEVALQFHSVPFLAFEGELARQLRPNTLVLRIQPDEGISLHFGAKVPGEAFRVQSVAMDFDYDQAFAGAGETDGYPRLLHDAMIGDATLFIRTDEVEQAWRIVDPYLEAWSEPGGGLHFYAAGHLGAPRRRPPAGALRRRVADPVSSDPVHRAPTPVRRRRRRPSPTRWREPFAAAAGPRLLPGALGRPARPGPATSGWPPWRRRASTGRPVDVYMGDERLVPPDDPDANQRLVREALLDPVGAVGSVHPHAHRGRARRVRRRLRAGRSPPAGPGVRPRPPGHGARRPHGLALPRRPRPRGRPRPAGGGHRGPQRRNPHPRLTLTLAGHRPGPAGRLHRQRAPPSASALAAPGGRRRHPRRPGAGRPRVPLARRRRGGLPGRAGPVTADRRPTWTELLDDPAGRPAAAAASRAATGPTGNRVTYSPKVFIPLTMLCRDRCGYCTFAKAPARLAVALPVARRGPGHRPGRAATPAATRPSSPWASARRSATRRPRLAGRARPRLDRRLPGRRLPGGRSKRPACSPTPTPGPSAATSWPRLRPVTASQGMMLETLTEDLAAHRRAPDKDPARRLATLEAAGRLAIPFTTGHPGRHRRVPGRPARRPWWPSPTPTPATATSRRSSSRTSCPSRARPWPAHPPCPPDELAVVRSPPPVCCCPPTSTCRPRPTCPTTWPRCSTSGIDDWGGVSPVTADHVNPERAWPALDVLRAATEAAGHTLAPRLTVYPEFALDPERWLDPALRFAVLDASDAEGLARDGPLVLGR